MKVKLQTLYMAGKVNGFLRWGKYDNGRTAILITSKSGAPLYTATVNAPELHLNSGEVFIKDWSSNEGVLKTLVDAGVVALIEMIPYNYVKLAKCRLLVGPTTD